MRSARQQEIVAALGLPAGALVVSLLVFGVFVACSGANPFAAYSLMYTGGFGTWFSWQNTLQRAAPLILTALCTAIPAHLGLVIIGGEGALVLGGLGAAVMALQFSGGTPWLVQLAMALAGMVAGGMLILVAGALRHYRGVNETISSLLLTYIAIAVFNHLVEGPMRDPASLNKPSTAALSETHMLGLLPGMEVHWGLVYGLLACVVIYVLMSRTVFGFAARMAGGNARAAQLSGLTDWPSHPHRVFPGRGRGRAGWHGRGGGRARPCQRLAGRGIWLYGHPGRLPGPPPSAGHYPCRHTPGRHWCQWRITAAAFGITRCHGPGVAGHPVCGDSGQ